MTQRGPTPEKAAGPPEGDRPTTHRPFCHSDDRNRRAGPTADGTADGPARTPTLARERATIATVDELHAAVDDLLRLSSVVCRGCAAVGTWSNWLDHGGPQWPAAERVAAIARQLQTDSSVLRFAAMRAVAEAETRPQRDPWHPALAPPVAPPVAHQESAA